MDFTEYVKKEVKEKAAFRCCRCQQIGIHVHHIMPQECGGSSDIDNAAPLCPSCHDYFGGNPEKRKEIRQMRDWWYERVTMMYPDNRQMSRFEDIDNKLDKVLQSQISLDEYKQVLFTYNHELFHLTNEMINNMTLGTAITSGSGIVNASYSPSASPSPSPSPEAPEDETTD
jgi:hypothetical protein